MGEKMKIGVSKLKWIAQRDFALELHEEHSEKKKEVEDTISRLPDWLTCTNMNNRKQHHRSTDQQRVAQAIWLSDRPPCRPNATHGEVNRPPDRLTQEYCIGVAMTALLAVNC